MKKIKGFAWIPVLILAGLVILGGGAYWYVHQNAVPVAQEQSSQSSTTTDTTAGWKTYSNTRYDFQVEYPQGWKTFGSDATSGIIFGRKERDAAYDGELYVSIETRSIARLIQDQKTVEQDRAGHSVVETKSVTVNDIQGTALVVHNTELQKTKPDWELHMVMFEKGGQTYVLSNGAIKSDLFDIFYKSFKLLQTVSVPGMSKYIDSDFGFSFWYPSSWKVVKGQNSIQLNDQYGRDTYLGITINTPPDGKLLLPGFSCGPAAGCADLIYYFDAIAHTWMEQYPTGRPSAEGSEILPPGTAEPADVSRNTMGGLHMLSGNLRFGLGTVIPLSARDFIFVSAAPGGLGGGEHNFQDYLARTIVATDPSVATPVSATEQMKIIQAEKDAYATQ